MRKKYFFFKLAKFHRLCCKSKGQGHIVFVNNVHPSQYLSPRKSNLMACFFFFFRSFHAYCYLLIQFLHFSFNNSPVIQCFKKRVWSRERDFSFLSKAVMGGLRSFSFFFFNSQIFIFFSYKTFSKITYRLIVSIRSSTSLALVIQVFHSI
jgi:hypothetical protein